MMLTVNEPVKQTEAANIGQVAAPPPNSDGREDGEKQRVNEGHGGQDRAVENPPDLVSLGGVAGCAVTVRQAPDDDEVKEQGDAEISEDHTANQREHGPHRTGRRTAVVECEDNQITGDDRRRERQRNPIRQAENDWPARAREAAWAAGTAGRSAGSRPAERRPRE